MLDEVVVLPARDEVCDGAGEHAKRNALPLLHKATYTQCTHDRMNDTRGVVTYGSACASRSVQQPGGYSARGSRPRLPVG